MLRICCISIFLIATGCTKYVITPVSHESRFADSPLRAVTVMINAHGKSTGDSFQMVGDQTQPFSASAKPIEFQLAKGEPSELHVFATAKADWFNSGGPVSAHFKGNTDKQDIIDLSKPFNSEYRAEWKSPDGNAAGAINFRIRKEE
jgi:hypothetical protein